MMKKLKCFKKIEMLLALFLSICMTVTSLYPTNLAEVFAADEGDVTTTVWFLNTTEDIKDVYAYAWVEDDKDNKPLGDWPGEAVANVEGTQWYKVDVTVAGGKQFGIKFHNNAGNELDYGYINAPYVFVTPEMKRYDTALAAEVGSGITTSYRKVYPGSQIESTKIEAEIMDEKKLEAGINYSGVGVIDRQKTGEWTEYNLYFNRDASKINVIYSNMWGDNSGQIDVCIDDINSKSLATLHSKNTVDWNVYEEATADVNIPAGYHRVYLKYTSPKEGSCFGNIDGFTFESSYENAIGMHEAESAHSYTYPTLTTPYRIEESGNFSGGKALGSFNVTGEERAYFTHYVRTAQAGNYTLKIKYATDCSSVRMDYRINQTSWVSTKTDANTGSWDQVKDITATVRLRKGINIIDITGAINADGEENWVNIDGFELTKADDERYTREAFSFRDTSDVIGNKIEAESAESWHQNIGMYTGNVGNVNKGEWVEYNVYFDRKATGMKLRYAGENYTTGRIKVYIDDMESDPVGTVTITSDDATSSWNDYKEKEANNVLDIPEGSHKVYLVFDPNQEYMPNIDWFSFIYTPENVQDRHEVENAHAFANGFQSPDCHIDESPNFSGNEAVGGLNFASGAARSFATHYVDAESDSWYELTIGYSNGSSYDTNIAIRLNSNEESEWLNLPAPKTGGWDTVKEIKTTVLLKKGINIIDISGAANIDYAKDDSWQWVNLDYFNLQDNNIAYKKNATASNEEEDLSPGNVVDGDEKTRWANRESLGWICVDLGSLYEIHGVDILFEAAYAKDFNIATSKDGETWVRVKTVRGFSNPQEDGSHRYVSPDSCLGKARYVKIEAVAMGAHVGMSIYELRMYGEKVPGSISEVAVGKEVTVSGEKTQNPASNAVDGKDTTRWAVGPVNSIEYEIDLGKTYELRSIDLKFSNAYAEAFTILTSEDGQEWTDLKKVTGWTEPGDASGYKTDDILGYGFHFSPTNARYVKLIADKSAKPDWGLSIYEFEVWAKDNDKLDYWSNIHGKAMGVYPVTKLQDTKYENSVTQDYPLGVIDSSLVTGDVLMTDDTYEVVYDKDKRDLFFYVNPRDKVVNYGEFENDPIGEVFWSNGNSGTALWGAENHDENIAKYVAKQQATVQYQLPENLDFGGKDYVTTQIGCRIYNSSDIENGVPKTGTNPIFSIRFNLKVLNSHGIYIDDTLSENGSINVKNADASKVYVWEKSKDGKTWTTVEEKRKDIQIISNNTSTVNVADDLGGGYYYRVKEAGGEWSQPYKIPYYNNVQNGGFEYPAMFASTEENSVDVWTRFPLNAGGDEQQYPNGFEGLFWKSTGPGYGTNKTTHDVEIVNARNLREEGAEGGQQSGFSVSQLEMYGDNSHGDQFAELNCEEQGALYQDILTSPGAECYWDLDHAARMTEGTTNSMLVVAMSSNDAKKYTKDTEIQKIVEVAGPDGMQAVSSEYEEGKVIELEPGVKATVWKVTSKNVKGQWKHNSGKYIVPSDDKNYLTRFFFVSIEGTNGNKTIGNLIDNITLEQRTAYTIEYYVNGELKHTETGITDPYDRVDIPDSISEVDLKKFTLSKSTMVQYERTEDGNIKYEDGVAKTQENPFLIDENDRRLTVAYDHNHIKLYYESGIVTITKRVEGLTQIPDDYSVKITIKDGSNEKCSVTFNKSDFNAVDKTDAESGYFATETFKVGANFDSGKTYTVLEENIRTMINYEHYLDKVMIEGQECEVPLAKETDVTSSFSATNFIYNVEADNTVLVVNHYKTARAVTLTKKVTGNMGLKEKDVKSFKFTVSIKQNDTFVDAVKYEGKDVEYSSTGTYNFNLKDNEQFKFLVYDGCAVTVEEQKEEWYSTKYEVEGVNTTVNDGVEVEDNKNPVMTTEPIRAIVNIVCINDSTDLGDVEVQGFQMNTDTSEGAPAEFSPSYRVVCRVSKNTINRRKVIRAGVIFGTADAVGTGQDAIANLTVTNDKVQNLDNHGSVEAERDGVDGKLTDAIYYHEETPGGYYEGWTTKADDEHPATHWNYFALTFIGKSYLYGTITQNITYRAYAVVEGTEDDFDFQEEGRYYKYEYGKDIYTTNIYKIAEHLYTNHKMSTEKAHNFLYNNILNVVTMDRNRLDIAQAMMKRLGVKSTSDPNYDLINACYKNMFDYVHCLSGYKYYNRGNVVPNDDFVMKNYNVGASIEECNSELLRKLNESTGTDYKTLSGWIYGETGKVVKNKSTGECYSGYYEKVSYDWSNGVVTDYDED